MYIFATHSGRTIQKHYAKIVIFCLIGRVKATGQSFSSVYHMLE